VTEATSLQVDLLIVGAGPVGLFGAYYAGVRTLSTAVLDSLEEPGGQITAMYPEKAIFDVAGFPAIKGRQLVEQLLAQAAPFNPHYLLGHQAVGLERGDGGFALTTATGHRIETRAIVITGGIGTFTPRPLPAGGEYLGRGLVHFVPHTGRGTIPRSDVADVIAEVVEQGAGVRETLELVSGSTPISQAVEAWKG